MQLAKHCRPDGRRLERRRPLNRSPGDSVRIAQCGIMLGSPNESQRQSTTGRNGRCSATRGASHLLHCSDSRVHRTMPMILSLRGPGQAQLLCVTAARWLDRDPCHGVMTMTVTIPGSCMTCGAWGAVGSRQRLRNARSNGGSPGAPLASLGD